MAVFRAMRSIGSPWCSVHRMKFLTGPTLFAVLLTIEVSAFGQNAVSPSVKEIIADIRQAQQEIANASVAAPAPHGQQASQDIQQRNRARLEVLRGQLKAAVMAKAPPEIAIIRQVEIPENASSAREEFIVQRAQIQNQRAFLLNSMRHANSEERQAALRQWDVNNRKLVAGLREMAAAVVEENRSKPVPEPLAVPPDASPAIRAFLTERRARLEELASNRRTSMPSNEDILP